MKRVLTALILIPLVLVFVFLGPKWQWLFTLAVAVVSMLASWECMNLAATAGARPPRIAVLVAIFLLFTGNYFWFQHTAAIVGLLCLLLFTYCTFFHSVDQVMVDSMTAVFTLVYTGFAMVALPVLREQTNGSSLVAFLLCAVWAGDSVALYVGKAWGRHKMAPTLSPNKSWEGALGSVAGSLLSTGILIGLSALLQSHDIAVLTYPEEWWFWLLLAVVVNVAAQAGDLAESALKRSVGVKDSGTLLPGHGGVLDRIDALLFAAPVLWYALVVHQLL
ncbi:MAG: phosphatidate cytidylyltransferase [Terracidiphilus sp.]|nr:phosphatidate cytidylyltransferase [Terracidiphilus sp.]